MSDLTPPPMAESVSECQTPPPVPGKLRGKPQEAWLQMQYVWTLD